MQSKRSQFRARGIVIRVKYAPNAETLRDLDEHRRVFDVKYLPGRRLGDVQRQPIDVRVGLAEADEAGGDKRIHELRSEERRGGKEGRSRGAAGSQKQRE